MPEPPPLWSDAFLADEIREQPEYQALDDDSAEFDKFVSRARQILGDVHGIKDAAEQLTIERAITPLLEALGWPTPLPQLGLTARDEVDLALYAEGEQREALLRDSERDQVLGAAGIVECKAWDSPFDTSGSGSRPGETAAQQLQRYLLIAGADSGETLRWGILTNGARWRIYSYRARPRERAWEIDLDRLLVSQDLFDQQPNGDKLHQLRLAWLLLRRDSWVPAPSKQGSFLDRLLASGLHADEQIAADLSNAIFRDVYPDLVTALWGQQEDATAADVANAALTFLYRLLFIFYAEDRGMLDTEDPSYRDYSLRYGVREPAVRQVRERSSSTDFSRFWDHIATLTRVLDRGNPAMGLPPYDGGLFASEPGSLLARARLTDAQLAPIIASLSHTAAGEYVSYRRLEIQQLGSIYERLLERVPQRGDDGQINVATSPYARKDSGSYYTPQELVDLIVEQTLRPLRDERVAAFEANPNEDNDPAAALLRLKVLDPAMGSGHFLITAIDWLATEIEELLERYGSDASEHVSPVLAELQRIEAWRSDPLHASMTGEEREEIEQRRAVEQRYPPPDRRALIRRMVLKRCIYGVDKNPMAVELAKVALWLHTFTPPLPLPYLNHRVRAGDSLLGIPVDAAHDYLAPWGPSHIARGLFDDRRHLAQNTEVNEKALAENLDLTILAIGESARHDRIQIPNRGRLRKVLNLIVGLRWLSIDMKVAERKEFHEPLEEALGGDVARADAILHNGENDPGLTPATPEFHRIRDQANEIASRENIFHWEVEFPQVLDAGGFDAVITNPPWDRIKLQEVEWWAARREEIAKAPTDAVRKEMIAELRAAGDPLAAEYDEAAERAAQLSVVLRKSGDYPQLGKGDLNLYSLLVERSLSLVNPRGIVGILTPSGIYADKTAAQFFRDMSTNGRIGSIYDFENRRSANPEAATAKWFPDVDTRFKFCATIFAGSERRFEETRCGFYLNSKSDVSDSDRVFPLTPADFARINPNTGTAPILRSRRDAELLSRIYREHPILVNHSPDEAQRPFDVRYFTMFHMANDSHLFRTAVQLKDDGFYPVVGHRYGRGDERWAPLYQGRMIHQFDHRANAVGFNPDSVTNPYFSIDVDDLEKQDPEFFPTVRYWVSAAEIEHRLPASQSWAIAFRDIARSTDERTMVPAIVPWAAFGHSIALLLPDPTFNANDAVLLAANLVGFAFDFVARQKIQGAHMSWYILEQLPVIAPADYDRAFGETSARELVRDHVLRLSYTAHDLEPFARDLGYEGEPFIWNPAERRQLRARLDALYFHLYGLDEDDTAYILDQFPVLEKNERKEHGRYLTKELVLGYHRALAAGDTESEIRLD